jgi:cell division protein FtsB
MTNEEKAKLYDQLLSEHARKASQVRALEVDIRPAADQQQKIDKLRKEMVDLEKRATELSMSAF